MSKVKYVFELENELAQLYFKDKCPYFQIHTHFHIDGYCRQSMIYVRENRVCLLRMGTEDTLTIKQHLN